MAASSPLPDPTPKVIVEPSAKARIVKENFFMVNLKSLSN
jgi:hypothetical protein